MKKHIQLLIENIFDDIYNNENDLDSEIASHVLYNYFPTSKKQLRQIIINLLNERGKDADMNDIDVSNITDMSNLFDGLDPYNIDISKWNVSSVTNMMSMFFCCSNFNCDLSQWNVSSVTDKWNVSSVTDMCQMFWLCHIFNSNLNKWDVSSVTDMFQMFFKCYTFEGNGLKDWNVESVGDMTEMFYECENFNCDLTNWQIYSLYKCNYLNIFKGCKSLKNKRKYLTEPKK